ncbi:stalk domain-containing protein [Brevibacillus daliensis]|uniref:stalk domain-containing protein n=1 Tax=Brevibacillus daliensis TaxID=2892995 RepID=UPI001E4A66F6|nr:stalk domain-containing protein [Brevibacillus daliensis]
MKKIILAFLSLLLFITGSASGSLVFAASAPKTISVLIDGLPVEFDVAPLIKNGRVMVPFKAVADALHVPVTWDNQNQMVHAKTDTINIQLQINNSTAYVNGNAMKLDAAPFTLKGRTLIPLSFFTGAFGARAEWDGALQQVRIFTAPASMEVTGYYGLGNLTTGSSSWTNLFRQDYPNTSVGNTDLVSRLAFCWYYMDQNGNFVTNNKYGWQKPGDWQNVPAVAQQYRMKTEMTIFMADGNGELTALLANDQAKAAAIANIVQEARNFQGVNIDFEGLGLTESGAELKKVQDSYTNFIRILSQQLKQENLTLSLSLPPLNGAYSGYDYAALGSIADQIIIMAYDYNQQGNSPEPDNRVMQAVTMAKAVVPKEKLLLGINLAHENEKSIINKVGIAKRTDIKGIALWRLGLLSDQVWNALRTTVKVEN